LHRSVIAFVECQPEPTPQVLTRYLGAGLFKLAELRYGCVVGI
jgi:hypothetical protein